MVVVFNRPPTVSRDKRNITVWRSLVNRFAVMGMDCGHSVTSIGLVLLAAERNEARLAIVMFVRPSVRLSVCPSTRQDYWSLSTINLLWNWIEIELILSLALHCARAIHFQVSIYGCPYTLVISAYLMSQQIGVLVKVEFRCPNSVQYCIQR